MGMTKKDLDEFAARPNRFKRFIEAVAPALVRMLRLVTRIGPLRRALARTAGGRMGAICRHKERGEHKQAVAAALEALKQKKWPDGDNGEDAWDLGWLFLSSAAESLAQYDDPATWDELIAVAEAAPPPVGEYCAASTYVSFARWKTRQADYRAALAFVETASRADRTWAEPDFLLGWLYLVIGGGDPLSHLMEAVQKDPGMLSLIARDPICRQRPDILAKLKEISAKGIQTRGEERLGDLPP